MSIHFLDLWAVFTDFAHDAFHFLVPCLFLKSLLFCCMRILCPCTGHSVLPVESFVVALSGSLCAGRLPVLRFRQPAHRCPKSPDIVEVFTTPLNCSTRIVDSLRLPRPRFQSRLVGICLALFSKRRASADIARGFCPEH